MYKAFFTVLILILLFLTAGIAIRTPKMHKNIFLYDSNLKIDIQENETIDTKIIPTKINPVKVKPTIKNTAVSPKTAVVQTETKIVQTPLLAENKSTTKIVQTKLLPQKAKTPENIMPQKTALKQTQTQTAYSKTQEEKEQEELILWNKWRSDLQNRIMSDVKLPIVKQGTIFKFSFDVDKYGKITNISTWSTDPNYTPYAIQYIAPVIRSYQGRDFMNFPAGSNRVTTTVSGAWKISDKMTYSSPSDYTDVEKIRN